MRIVIIGGSGLIGSRVVKRLADLGHDAVAASPSSGVDTLTGTGVRDVMEGASVVVDVSNSPSFEDDAVMRFFQTSTRNLLSAEIEAGVNHHVALSVVGTERLGESGYFRAKIAQEEQIRTSPIPYTIVHATQFFEFLESLATIQAVGDVVRVPPVWMQPMAADDVAAAVANVAVQPPLQGTLEIGGPAPFRMNEIIERRLRAANDLRSVVIDPHARYSGATLDERTLVPGPGARLGSIRFDDWLVANA
ncbi:MAG: SDR family oxidoreductase [Kofleriaceae bacterium]